MQKKIEETTQPHLLHIRYTSGHILTCNQIYVCFSALVQAVCFLLPTSTKEATSSQFHLYSLCVKPNIWLIFPATLSMSETQYITALCASFWREVLLTLLLKVETLLDYVSYLTSFITVLLA